MDTKSLQLARELAPVINRLSMEGTCNTPDFVLADFLVDALALLARTVNARDRWYGMTPFPGSDWRRDAQLAGYLSGALEELHGTHPEAIYKAILAFRALPEEPSSPPEGM